MTIGRAPEFALDHEAIVSLEEWRVTGDHTALLHLTRRRGEPQYDDEERETDEEFH